MPSRSAKAMSPLRSRPSRLPPPRPPRPDALRPTQTRFVMIQLRSILEVADNTGARRAAMISRKGQNTDTAAVGDIVTIHIKESTTDATVKKGEVAKAVVVRTKAPVRRSDGSYLRFDS